MFDYEENLLLDLNFVLISGFISDGMILNQLRIEFDK